MVNLYAIQADLIRRKEALDRALTANSALPWLKSYGPRGPQDTRESIGASVSQNYASACVGAKEARQYLERAILEKFGEINERAIALAEQDVAAVEGGRAAAQAHYEQRILSALSSPSQSGALAHGEALRELDEWLCQFLNCASDEADTPEEWREETKRNFSRLCEAYSHAHTAGVFTHPAPQPRGPVVALTYGQKLIAEAIEAHFGERKYPDDDDADDTTNRDVWEAFEALTGTPSPAQGGRLSEGNHLETLAAQGVEGGRVAGGNHPSPAQGPMDGAVPDDEAYEIGKRDGYSDAVQTIDCLTGGDGEYRYCTNHDPERHTPDPATMIQRIVARFQALASAPQPSTRSTSTEGGEDAGN